MAKITGIISDQYFEVIRDRIALILKDELCNQATLTSNKLFDADVYLERFIPFSHEELPALNIMFARSSYDNKSIVSVRGTNTYFIDVYAKSKNQASETGDTLASKSLHKLIGVIRAILESPHYLRLDFDSRFIHNTIITDIQIAEPQGENDATHTITGRITFQVVCTEVVAELEGVVAEQYNSEVRISDSEKGFRFVVINQ